MQILDFKVGKERNKFNRKQKKLLSGTKIKDNQVHKLARFFDECKEQ